MLTAIPLLRLLTIMVSTKLVVESDPGEDVCACAISSA